MNAPTELPTTETLATEQAMSPYHQTTRIDGWTPERQRTFLEAIADGHSVESAAQLARMRPSGAYALRRRAQGGAFAIGWAAANLIARDVLADTLMTRAIDGQIETITRANGDVVEKLRYDNRLAGAMLARADRQVEATSIAAYNAARMVAQEFDAFLDMIEKDPGPARAGLFLGARAADAVDLEPVRALARADRFLRAAAALPQEVDTADLDPAARAGWTGEQWARAEAAGLVALAPETSGSPEPENNPDSPSLTPLNPGDDAEPEPVWLDDIEGEERWQTSFPPPPDFYGEEQGEYGEEDYQRDLSPEEEDVADAPRRADVAARWATDAAARDAWFGFTPEPADEDDDEDADEEGDVIDHVPDEDEAGHGIAPPEAKDAPAAEEP